MAGGGLRGHRGAPPPSVIDLYCERTGPGLLAEPFNAATNACFLVAAFVAWRASGPRPDGRALALLVAAIGIGSGLFHTFATNWAQWLDVLPIALFQVTWLALWLRAVLRLSPARAAMLVVAFVAALPLAGLWPQVLNGSLAYAPALLTLAALGCVQPPGHAAAPRALRVAAAVFTVSLAARTADLALCAAWPLGTHWLWHALNALVLGLVTLAYLRASAQGASPSTSGSDSSRTHSDMEPS